MTLKPPAHSVSCARATSLLAAIILLQLPTCITGGIEAARVPVGGGWSGGGGVDGTGGGTGGEVEQSRLFESESSWQQYRKILPPRRPAPLNTEIQVVEKGAGEQGQDGGSHVEEQGKRLQTPFGTSSFVFIMNQ